MVKFIELEEFDIKAGRVTGIRMINVDAIRELIEYKEAGHPVCTRVYLFDNHFVDVNDTRDNVREKIEKLG